MSNAKSDNRAEINAFHAVQLHEGIGILDVPSEYDDTPGYYALLYFSDLQGIPFELVHQPRLDPILGLLVVWFAPSTGLRADHSGPAIHPNLPRIQQQRGCRVHVEFNTQCTRNVRVFNG